MRAALRRTAGQGARPTRAAVPAGDTQALARLLRRVECEPRFVARLGKVLARRAPLFRPAREIAAWRRLLASLWRQSASLKTTP